MLITAFCTSHRVESMFLSSFSSLFVRLRGTVQFIRSIIYNRLFYLSRDIFCYVDVTKIRYSYRLQFASSLNQEKQEIISYMKQHSSNIIPPPCTPPSSPTVPSDVCPFWEFQSKKFNCSGREVFSAGGLSVSLCPSFSRSLSLSLSLSLFLSFSLS